MLWPCLPFLYPTCPSSLLYTLALAGIYRTSICMLCAGSSTGWTAWTHVIARHRGGRRCYLPLRARTITAFCASRLYIQTLTATGFAKSGRASASAHLRLLYLRTEICALLPHSPGLRRAYHIEARNLLRAVMPANNSKRACGSARWAEACSALLWRDFNCLPAAGGLFLARMR